MNEQEVIKIIKNEHCGRCDKKFLCNGCYIGIAIEAIKKHISFENILKRLEKAKRDFNYKNIDNWYMSRKEKEVYEDGINEAIDIIKEEGGINA